uniref:Uncharacterized protein n=1 Tax=Ustilaginoidea virens TaxID=1159556 RepID=A0A1X9WE73_USTVR|nr:hypothetical protein [Ustilaginoidea virens]
MYRAISSRLPRDRVADLGLGRVWLGSDKEDIIERGDKAASVGKDDSIKVARREDLVRVVVVIIRVARRGRIPDAAAHARAQPHLSAQGAADTAGGEAALRVECGYNIEAKGDLLPGCIALGVDPAVVQGPQIGPVGRPGRLNLGPQRRAGPSRPALVMARDIYLVYYGLGQGKHRYLGVSVELIVAKYTTEELLIRVVALSLYDAYFAVERVAGV